MFPGDVVTLGGIEARLDSSRIRLAVLQSARIGLGSNWIGLDWK